MPTRLFHWLTVALVLAAYVTLRLDRMNLHALTGEALLALLLFRLIWGLVGSDTARFARFLCSPRAAASHLAHVFYREPDRQIGHNPAGGWMVLLLLVLLLAEVLTGIVVNNDVADQGPLTEIMPAHVADVLTDLHALIWDALLAAVTLHVAAIVIYAVAKGHRLLPPMITGRKRLPEPSTPPRIASSILALALFGGSAIAATLLARYL